MKQLKLCWRSVQTRSHRRIDGHWNLMQQIKNTSGFFPSEFKAVQRRHQHRTEQSHLARSCLQGGIVAKQPSIWCGSSKRLEVERAAGMEERGSSWPRLMSLHLKAWILLKMVEGVLRARQILSDNQSEWPLIYTAAGAAPRSLAAVSVIPEDLTLFYRCTYWSSHFHFVTVDKVWTHFWSIPNLQNSFSTPHVCLRVQSEPTLHGLHTHLNST